MRRMKTCTMIPFWVYAMVLPFFLVAHATSPGGESEVSTVIFYVH